MFGCAAADRRLRFGGGALRTTWAEALAPLVRVAVAVRGGCGGALAAAAAAAAPEVAAAAAELAGRRSAVVAEDHCWPLGWPLRATRRTPGGTRRSSRWPGGVEGGGVAPGGVAVGVLRPAAARGGVAPEPSALVLAAAAVRRHRSARRSYRLWCAEWKQRGRRGGGAMPGRPGPPGDQRPPGGRATRRD